MTIALFREATVAMEWTITIAVLSRQAKQHFILMEKT